jgi:hypothetical protein
LRDAPFQLIAQEAASLHPKLLDRKTVHFVAFLLASAHELRPNIAELPVLQMSLVCTLLDIPNAYVVFTGHRAQVQYTLMM